ncbi:transglycosylase SLT domain-containing protein, partial [Nocardia sp. NPDC049526]|uniref:transglycosylase SLT domain-containing protein n=1 Tax=Nocardia sp. NPDC049526 TaxID=3364316 RepID=UPI0037BCAC5D
TSAKATASAINRLTNQYLYNIAGKKYSGGTSGEMPSGTVGDWIKQALQVLQQLGYDISKIDPQAIALIIQYESGGNPSATNNYDSNAAAGTPSIGLMQTIGPTFNQYAAAGHTNIYNPVDNIVAGVRYAISRYGSVSNVPGVKAVRSGRSYEPY